MIFAIWVAWWTVSRSHPHGSRWEQAVKSLEDRAKAQAAEIDALTVIREDDRPDSFKAQNAKLRQEIERLK